MNVLTVIRTIIFYIGFCFQREAADEYIYIPRAMAVSQKLMVKSLFALSVLGAIYWFGNEAPNAYKEEGYFGIMVISLIAGTALAFMGLFAFLITEILDDNERLEKKQNAAKKK